MRFLDRNHGDARSIVLEAYRKDVPVFVPALSDSSAGFGVIAHRVRAGTMGLPHLAFDSGKDFHELARIKLAAAETGLLMVGGGVPKNFAQDAVVAAQMLSEHGGAAPAPSGGLPRATGDGSRGGGAPAPSRDVPMHKYAVQLTVADVRDGGLSGSTLREATTWGKVETARERMVYGEATVTLSLLVSDAYHRGIWRQRDALRLGQLFSAAPATAGHGVTRLWLASPAPRRSRCSRGFIHGLLVLLALASATASPALAQTGVVQGQVVDAASRRPLSRRPDPGRGYRGRPADQLVGTVRSPQRARR